ncbi:hypothetical protein ACS0TY_015097 [Phlomoides rotata]
MRILSYNTRGIGSRAKCREINELIRSNRIEFFCIQETKKEKIDKFLERSRAGLVEYYQFGTLKYSLLLVAGTLKGL